MEFMPNSVTQAVTIIDLLTEKAGAFFLLMLLGGLIITGLTTFFKKAYGWRPRVTLPFQTVLLCAAMWLLPAVAVIAVFGALSMTAAAVLGADSFKKFGEVVDTFINFMKGAFNKGGTGGGN